MSDHIEKVAQRSKAKPKKMFSVIQVICYKTNIFITNIYKIPYISLYHSRPPISPQQKRLSKIT